MFYLLLQEAVKHPPAEDEGRDDRDGVHNGETEQHLDVFGEHVVIRVSQGICCISLIHNKLPCNNTIGNKDDDEVDYNISNHAIASMITVGDITTIDGVAPLENTCKVEGIKRYGKETPKPNE